MYHRVAVLPADPQLLAVTPDHFEEQLAVLSASGLRPTRLSELANIQTWPERDGVVLTFDDGYADNYLHARERLVRHNLPATFFISTDSLGGHSEFWWDELEGLLLADPTPAEGAGSWDVLHPPVSARQRAYLEHCGRLRPLPKREREREMQRLRLAAGSRGVAREQFRGLREEELRGLELPGLLDVGGHTMSHPMLSQLPVAEQWEEILGGAQALTRCLGHAVETFSYPFGTSADFTAETTALVREAGFTVACANYPGFAQLDTERLALPRCIVRDWDGPDFAARLARWRVGDFA